MRDKNIAAGAVLILIGVAGLILINFYESRYTPEIFPFAPGYERSFSSNGARIYYTATSSSGKPITASMGAMSMSRAMMSCVNCHGKDGKGGKVRMMMGSFEAPDIRYKVLTSGHHEGEPPYTDELIKRAITQGIDSSGKPLEFPMPKWSMSEEDLNDLLDYLKSLG